MGGCGGSLVGIEEGTAPFNLEAEQAFLAAVLANNNLIDRAAFLRPEHFCDPLHGQIYDAALKLILRGRQAAVTTVKDLLPSAVTADMQTADYLDTLARLPLTLKAEDCARSVYDLAVRRQLIAIGEELIGRAHDPSNSDDPSRQIEWAEQKLYEVADAKRYGTGLEAFSVALDAATDMAAAAYQRDGGLAGLATGFADLDNRMGGLQSSDLVILAGRPGMGKTALATNIAYNVAQHAVVGFFSLEMSREQLATRIISEQAKIPSERIRRGQITPDEFMAIMTVSDGLRELPLFIDHTGSLSVAQLGARARRLKRQRGLDLIVVDYLQLLSGTKSWGRVQEITGITTSLKALAKELDVPVLALSQLSREVERRDDKRPQLSDLRESGSIEQDADVVLFVYREAYYTERAQPREGTAEHAAWYEAMSAAHGHAEIIISKQRHGPTGTVTLGFTPEFTRFHNAI